MGTYEFIVKRRNGKNMTLFLRNWIRSGVNKVSNLHFVDGKLDMIHMYDVISKNNNVRVIDNETGIAALARTFINIDCVHYVQRLNSFRPKKSKDVYVNLKRC